MNLGSKIAPGVIEELRRSARACKLALRARSVDSRADIPLKSELFA